MTGIRFNREFDPQHGKLVDISPGIRRLTAPNTGPFTFTGTNTYVVGDGEVAVIDPGPMDPLHLDALLKQLGTERVSHIFVTHTHVDHSAGVGWLKQRTDAVTVGEGQHRASRPLAEQEINPLDASADSIFQPDIVADDGAVIGGANWALTAVHTPGHTENHMALDMGGSDHLFVGDHVMAWSTSIVAPPDGSMTAYMRSLDRLFDFQTKQFLSGHGAAIDGAGEFLQDLKTHRFNREKSILNVLTIGPQSVAGLVAQIYIGIDDRLKPAAGLSVLAHLEHLQAQGKVSKITGSGEVYQLATSGVVTV